MKNAFKDFKYITCLYYKQVSKLYDKSQTGCSRGAPLGFSHSPIYTHPFHILSTQIDIVFLVLKPEVVN